MMLKIAYSFQLICEICSQKRGLKNYPLRRRVIPSVCLELHLMVCSLCYGHILHKGLILNLIRIR